MRDVKNPEIRRAEIMDAAMLLFMEKGYTNTTTQYIVDKEFTSPVMTFGNGQK